MASALDFVASIVTTKIVARDMHDLATRSVLSGGEYSNATDNLARNAESTQHAVQTSNVIESLEQSSPGIESSIHAGTLASGSNVMSPVDGESVNADLAGIGDQDGAARAAASHSTLQNNGAPSIESAVDADDDTLAGGSSVMSPMSPIEEDEIALGDGPPVSMVEEDVDSGVGQDNAASSFTEQLEEAHNEYSTAQDTRSMAQGAMSHASESEFGPFGTFVSDLQVLSAVVDTFVTRWPPQFTQLCAILRGFSLDFSTLLWFDCIRAPLTHVEKMYFQCSIPVAILVAAVVVFLVSKVYHSYYKRDPDAQDKIQRLHVKLVHAATLSIFLAYAQICNYTFRTFQCISLTHGDGSIKWVIKSEPSLPCEGEDYEAMLKVAWAIIIVIPIGVPVLFTFLLLYSSRDINPPGLALQDQLAQRCKCHRAMQTSFLWKTYKPGKELYIT
jgi:hypothetical protein